MTPMTRTATFRARGGQGAQLAERLLRAASLMADVPGCELWLVQRDLDDPDMIRVTEMWASRQHCDAALNLPGVEKNAAQVMDLLDGPPLEPSLGEPPHRRIHDPALHRAVPRGRRPPTLCHRAAPSH